MLPRYWSCVSVTIFVKIFVTLSVTTLWENDHHIVIKLSQQTGYNSTMMPISSPVSHATTTTTTTMRPCVGEWQAWRDSSWRWQTCGMRWWRRPVGRTCRQASTSANCRHRAWTEGCRRWRGRCHEHTQRVTSSVLITHSTLWPQITSTTTNKFSCTS